MVLLRTVFGIDSVFGPAGLLKNMMDQSRGVGSSVRAGSELLNQALFGRLLNYLPCYKPANAIVDKKSVNSLKCL